MNFPDIDMDRMSSSLWPLSSLLLCSCQLFPASLPFFFACHLCLSLYPQ